MSRTTRAEHSVRALRWTQGVLPVLLATVTLAIALGYVTARWPSMSLLLVALLALAVGVVWSREFALGAILVVALVMLGAQSWFNLPGRAMLITTALIGLFALTVILDLGPDNPLRVPVSLTMLFAVLAVSAFVGSANRFVALYAAATFIAAPVAYVAIVHSRITIRSMRRIGLIVGAIIAVQLPIVLVQSRIVSDVDLMAGTFGDVGGTHVQSVVLGLAWTFALALLSGRKRVWLLPVGLAIAAVLLTSQTWSGFLFALLGTIGVGLTRLAANPKRGASALLQYGVVIVATIAILYIGYSAVGANLPGGLSGLTPSAIRGYLFSYNVNGNAGRFEGIRLILSQPSTTADLLIGRGTGLLTRSALLGQSAVSSSASIGGALDRATSATKSLYEIGVLGTLLYVVAVASAAGAVVRSWTSRRDELGIAVAGAAVGSAAIYIASAIYMTAWTTDAVAVLFWCLMGMAVKWGRLRSAELAPEGALETPPTGRP